VDRGLWTVLLWTVSRRTADGLAVDRGLWTVLLWTVSRRTTDHRPRTILLWTVDRGRFCCGRRTTDRGRSQPALRAWLTYTSEDEGYPATTSRAGGNYHTLPTQPDQPVMILISSRVSSLPSARRATSSSPPPRLVATSLLVPRWASFVNFQGKSLAIATVQCFLCCFGFCSVGHFNKPKTLTFNNVDFPDITMLGEQILQVLIGYGPSKIPDIKFAALHTNLLWLTFFCPPVSQSIPFTDCQV